MKTRRRQIVEVLRYFNFERVHKAMVALDWRWASPSAIEVPALADLKPTAKRLLSQVSRKYPEIASGGFVARLHANGEIGLAFEVDSYETGGM